MIKENYSRIVNYAKGLALAGLVAITSGCSTLPTGNPAGFNDAVKSGFTGKYGTNSVSRVDTTYTGAFTGKQFKINIENEDRNSLANKVYSPKISNNYVKKNTPSVSKSTKKQSLTQMTADFVDANPMPAYVLNSTKNKNVAGIKTGVVIDDSGKPTYTISYCAPSMKEFFNGMAMPFTLYRENKSTGKTEILPAYTRPCRSGGALSPEYGLVASAINGVGYIFGAKDSLVYNPFGDNPKLTWGIFLDQAAIAVIAGSMGGGSKTASKSSSTQTQQDNHSNDKPADKPVNPPIEPPVNPPTDSGYNPGNGGNVGQ
jgi:hypothetical protein